MSGIDGRFIDRDVGGCGGGDDGNVGGCGVEGGGSLGDCSSGDCGTWCSWFVEWWSPVK